MATSLRHRSQFAAAGLATFALIAAACGDDSDDSDGGGDRLQVAATVAPLTNIVANIGGERVEITGLIPDGANSHTYEAPPSDAEILDAADVLFYNGLQLEISVEQMAEATMGGDAQVVALGEETVTEDEYIFDFSFPEQDGAPNPHLWTSPPRGREYAEIVRDTLSDLDPDGTEVYEDNFEAFVEQIDELDEAMVQATATVSEDQRILLTYHDGYPYFAEHYGWEVVGAVQPSDFGEPTAAEVAELADQIEDEGVPAIFGSEVFPNPVMEQLADETGVEYYDDLSDDELPGEPGSDDRSWLGMLKENFILMVEAMEGDPAAVEAVDVSNRVPDTAHYPS